MKHIIDDADKNKYEAYSKEEVLEVIQEAISSGELPEEINGLVITLKNPIDNNGYKIAFCTQAKYNELQTGGQLEANCYYYITDDTTMDDINDELNYLRSDFESLDNRVEAVENGKVDKQYVTGSDKSQKVINDSRGLMIENDGGEESDAHVKVTPSSVEIQSSTYENGEGGTDRYRCKIDVTDTDITITKDIDDGNPITKSLFEKKYLYRHSIKMNFDVSNGYVYITLNIYNKLPNSSSSFNTIYNQFDNGERIDCTGFYRYGPVDGICEDFNVIELHKSTTVNGLMARISKGTYEGMYNYYGFNLTSSNMTAINDVVKTIEL